MVSALLQRLHGHYGPQQWWSEASRFEIVVGALLVQRTTWTNAARAIENVRSADLLSVEAIADSDHDELERLIRPAGFFRTKAVRLRGLARFVADHGGLTSFDVLSTEVLRQRFLSLPGVGPETADVITAYAFNRAVFVVDAYARRLFGRLDKSWARRSDTELKAHVETLLRNADELNELHALIVAHGKRYCRPSPCCSECPLRAHCEFPTGS